MWGRRQTSDDPSSICVQAVELEFTLDIPPACHRIRKNEGEPNFNKYNGNMAHVCVTPAVNSYPHTLSPLRFLCFSRPAFRFLLPHPLRVKALSASNTKTKLTGTEANRVEPS
jgi:hypothetical protein